MKTNGDVKIAGYRTVGDWLACKEKLIVGSDPASWKRACDNFFLERLRTRYFRPIDALIDSDELEGEGFSIVAIQCSLIEFLGSTVEGTSYRYRANKNTKLGQYEYDDSRNMFVRFLSTATPFKTEFSKVKARDFYTGVRCPLLHEARTKKNWVILAKHSRLMIDDSNPKRKIVNRDNLRTGFNKFVQWYQGQIQQDQKLQEALIRKFDSLCHE